MYLLAETPEQCKALNNDLLQQRPDLHIIGSYAEKIETKDIPEIINEINAAAPAVIISQMSFDRQEQLMVETRQYLNAEVWLALNDQMVLGEDRQTALKKLLDKWYRHSLDRLITRYNHHKDNADGAEEP